MCCLHSYYLRINRNHSSVIKKYTILQWFIHPPGQNWPALCWWGLRSMTSKYLIQFYCTCHCITQKSITFIANKLCMSWMRMKNIEQLEVIFYSTFNANQAYYSTSSPIYAQISSPIKTDMIEQKRNNMSPWQAGPTVDWSL